MVNVQWLCGQLKETEALLKPMKHFFIASLAFGTLSCLISISLTSKAFSTEFRSIDGSGNNIANPDYGKANIEFLRQQGNAYEDGISVPRGGTPTSTLPSPRLISNVVSDQVESVTNFLGASDWLWQWGQFIDHDMDFTSGALAPEAFYIPVPKVGDPNFNPSELENLFIPFGRSMPASGTGTEVSNPRQQMNEITSFIDASMIYGSDATRVTALRNTANPAMLETSLAANNEVLPMKNTAGLPNDNGGSSDFAQFFLSGDVRANEQIGLTATHALFVREHNRIVTDLSSRLEAGETEIIAKRQAAIQDSNNAVNNEDDFLYESARKLVGAQIQQITYSEFLPLLIGNDLDTYAGYDSTVDASISNEFATAAYRVGHTMLSATLKRPGVGDIALKDAFFNPGEVEENGIDTLLLGLARQESQEIDNLVIDGVRNFLFGPPGAGGLDLASLNIQRGRDHGLPGYAETYNDIFGAFIDSFDDLGSSGLGLFADDVLVLFEEAYDTVDQIDLWLGGISELPGDHGGLLGPTFSFFLADQFGRTRDGDRFFYLDDAILEHLELLDQDFANTQLSDIILRNSSITAIQSNVFIAVVPEPSSLALLSLTGCLLACRRRLSPTITRAYPNRDPAPFAAALFAVLFRDRA